MSWAVEEWKQGLPTKALQKIQEIETQLDKLKKERQQRQFQLESLEAALLKQKQKVENEKTETSVLKREHQSLIESCDNLEKTRQKISHDLQVKESQVNYLEGQLASSKKRMDILEQENKRYNSELERSQQIATPADVQPRTPQRNLSGPMTPIKNVADSKLEELQEKYNKEMEERRRLESELKIIQTKLINKTQPQSTVSHRNIARQRSSSVFPWQQSQTPSQQTSLSLETPLKKGAAMNLQWEQEETPLKHCPKSLQKATLSTGLFNNSMDSSKQEEQLKLQNQELQTKVMDLEFRLQAQEKEMKNHTNRLHEIQFQFDKAKADLSDKECKLNKCRDDLTKMTTQCEQANTKCVMVEQKLKQVSDELSCHRQNADSTWRNMEQKLKDKERDFQQELSHQQHALQSLDQQFNQMKNKLNQEIQQAKNDYNVLQSEIDRVSAHKQKLEREQDEIKQQLSCSNQMVKENQTKENDLKKKLENIQEERNCLNNQLHQNSTQIHQLEDELKKNKQEFNRFRNFGEEMKNNNNIQEAEIKNLREKLDEQNKSMHINTEKLEQQISHLKMELASAFKDVKEKERNSEQLNVQVGTMENEIEELQKNMQLREKAFQALKEESSSLTQWKVQNMHIVNDFQCEKEVMENKIKELQQSLEVSVNKNQQQEQNLEIYQCKSEQQSEKLKSLEDEKENLQSQTDNLKNTLDNKTAELDTQKQAFEEFMKKARQEEQKHGKEVENLHLSISQLTAHKAELEKNLQEETNKVVKLEESQGILCADYENISTLAKSKDCFIELKETEILNLKDQILQTTNNLKEQLAKVDAEKNHFMQEYEKSLLDNLEIENIKSTLENYQHDISSFKEQIASQESSIKLEKQQRSEMESKYETLLKLREELEEKNEETEKKYQILQADVEQKIHQLKIQHAEALQETINEKDKYIQNIAQELETNTNNLKCLQITNKELEAKLEVCLQFEKCIQEKEELISLKEKELGQLVEENEELKSSINTVMQENVELNKINSSFADVVKSEATLQEQTKKYEEDAATKENTLKELKTLHEELTVKQRLLEKTVADKENAMKQLSDKINEKVIKEDGLIYQHAALEEELKHLGEKCIALEENKDFLEKQLHERSQELMKKITEVEELERNHVVCSTEYNAKIVGYEEKIKTMIEEMKGLQTQLKKMDEIDNLKKELSESCARQNKILEEHNELLQEKEQLTDLIKKQVEKETMFATKLENLENDLIIAQSENIKNSKLIAEKTLTSDQLKDTVITKETELQKFQAQLQLLQMDLEDKEASLESYISQLEQLQTENSNVESKFQHCEENRTLLQKELRAVRAEMEAMDLKFSVSKDSEELLREQITLQKQTIEELKSEFKKQKEDLDSLEIQLAKSQNAEKQCQLKEKDIKQLQEKLFQSEIQISDLMCRNGDIESQMEARHQELKTQMQITLSNMENTLQQSEEQRTLVQKDLSKVQSELSSMHLHFIESKNREEYLMEQIALQKKTIEDLTSEIEKCKEQEALLNSMVSELQSLIATLETEKASLLSKVDFTHKVIDLGAQEYTAVKEMIVSQETRHQNIPEEKAMADNVVENEPSGEKKSLLNTIDKSNYVVEELKAELSLLQSNLIETQSALSGTKTEKETLQSQLRVLESSLDNAQIHMSAQKEHLEQLENVIQEKGDEVILLQQQLKENSTTMTVNDQTTMPVKDTHLKLRTVELEDCHVTSEQSTTLLKELQKQQDSVDQTWKLHQTLAATRQELESLKQQHSFEIEEWQLKLTNRTTEMENKLVAQKQQTELISAELEDARIQLQSLDLSTQSLLYASYLSEESTPHKLKRTDSKKQQRELTLTTGQLELVNILNVAPDSKVQREQKASLQSGTTSKSPGYCTIHFGNAENVSKDIDDELNEINIKKEQVVEQIHLANEVISVPVECQSTCEIPIGSQLQFEQESGQILHLLPDEEIKKVTEALLSEMENLRSKLDSHQNELFFKAAAYTELEKKMLLFEEEKQHLCNELKSSALENQNLSDKVKYLEEELINMTLQLNVDKVKLSDVTKALESLEVDKKDRNEQVLELENELKRTKSDKTNLEKHILEMEVDLDELQTRKQSLGKELESSQRTISVQVEKLTELEAENNGVILELSTLAKTNNELEQTSKRREVKVQELEAEKIYNSSTIWGLEAEVKKLTNKLQAVAEQMKNVSKEKEDMIQEVQYLEKNSMLDIEGREEMQQQLNQLKKENLSMVEQTEAMQNKLNTVELEKLKLLQSLESSKLQKGEVAARLNSTETEVAEMRPAIEKLKVRIEADQNKSRHMAEKLKIGERKADSLQDRIEALERELQTSEENMEQIILQAETAKEQVETLKEEKETITEKLELLTLDLNSLLSEKQSLEKQLQQSQEKLERHCSNLSGKFEAAEKEKLNMTEIYESSVNELQSQISHLNEQVKMCHKEVEKLKENEKNNLNQNSNLECEKIRLSNQIHETDRLNVELQSASTILSKDLQVIQQQVNKHIEEKEKHQQQIADLEQLKQKDSKDLCTLQIEVENLKRERENLQTAAAESQQAAQDLSAKHRVMQETKEKSEKLLQNELQVSQLQASELLSQVKDLTENNHKLQDDLCIINEKMLKMQQEFDAEKNLISAQLEEFSNQTKNFKHEIQVESYKEKMAEMEHQVTAQDMEINNLKAAKEELNVALKDAASKVNDLTENNQKIQDGLTVANGKILKMQQEFDAEKNLISAQLEEFSNQTKNFKSQLEISQSEKSKLEQDVGYFQNELQITDVLKKEVDEHKQRLRCIQEEHQAVLKDLQDQHEIQVESYKEKMAEMEHQVTAQDMEINNLKAAKEELNVALKDAASKVNDLTENNQKIQDGLTVANGNILKMQQEFDAEKNLISAQSEEFKNQTESFKLQLEISRSEKYKLEQDVGYFQNELQITDVLKKEVDEHKQRLRCIQEEHQAVLKDLQDQHEVQVNSYQENLARMEQQLTAQNMEMNNLKTAKEEVDVALKDAASKHEVQVNSYQENLARMEQQLTAQNMEMDNLKTAKEEVDVALKDAASKAAELQKSVTKLKGDKDCAQNKLLLWMKSCKQLEHEKESLKKHIRQQEELLAKLQKSQILEGPDSQIEKLTAEMKELKEALEEKTKEADENMEKNWNLIKSSHKLEEENEMLKSRVVLLNNKLQQLNTRDENAVAEQVAGPRSVVHKKREKRLPGQSNSQQKHLNSPDVSRIVGLNLDAPLELAVNKIHKKCPESNLNLTTKRVRASESKGERDELKSEALENSAKRTRSDKELGVLLRSTAQDKTSHEPEGLPHLVKKGFANIPAVSHSPYILRRTTLLNRASSEFAVQSRISPHRQTQHKGAAQTCNKSEMTAEDSHAQQHPTESTRSSPELFLESLPAMAEPPLSSLTNTQNKMGYDTSGGKQSQKRRCSPNAKESAEQNKPHKEQITMSKESENCKVQ